jgi:L-ribulose-5-phosphate 3-epimerase
MAKQGEAADLRIGVCDWSLGGAGNLKSLELAAKAGLEGVQISPAGAADKLSFCSDKVRDAYRQAVKDTGMQIASVGLAITNECPLASDPRGPAWLEQAIDTAAALGCRPILLAFFGRGDLLDDKTGQLKAKDVDVVVERLKAAAPRAKDKGVVLALESWLSAKDTVAILDRVNSPAVGMYYDIANSTSRGYDVPAEIRSLKGRIAEFHFKDNKGLFGAGQVDVPPIAKAITEIGYKGWLILEQHHGPDAVAYYRKNAEYVRKLFGLKVPGGGAGKAE